MPCQIPWQQHLAGPAASRAPSHPLRHQVCRTGGGRSHSSRRILRCHRDGVRGQELVRQLRERRRLPSAGSYRFYQQLGWKRQTQPFDAQAAERACGRGVIDALDAFQVQHDEALEVAECCGKPCWPMCRAKSHAGRVHWPPGVEHDAFGRMERVQIAQGGSAGALGSRRCGHAHRTRKPENRDCARDAQLLHRQNKF